MKYLLLKNFNDLYKRKGIVIIYLILNILIFLVSGFNLFSNLNQKVIESFNYNINISMNILGYLNYIFFVFFIIILLLESFIDDLNNCFCTIFPRFNKMKWFISKNISQLIYIFIMKVIIYLIYFLISLFFDLHVDLISYFLLFIKDSLYTYLISSLLVTVIIRTGIVKNNYKFALVFALIVLLSTYFNLTKYNMLYLLVTIIINLINLNYVKNRKGIFIDGNSNKRFK